VRVPGLELDAQPGEALAGRGLAEGIGVTLGVVLRDSILLAAHAVEVAVVDVEPGARSALALDVPLHHVRLVDSVEHRAFALLRRTFDEGPADVDRLLLVGNGECFDHQMALARCSTMRANGSPVAISSCFHWPCAIVCKAAHRSASDTCSCGLPVNRRAPCSQIQCGAS